MKTMAAGSFKVHCLAVMDEVQAKREAIVIPKHGKPVVKLVPADKGAGGDRRCAPEWRWPHHLQHHTPGVGRTFPEGSHPS
jgi:prevent-host-death family protein